MALRRWIVAYDITDDLRRARAASILLDAGLRLQQSVYEVDGPSIRGLRERLDAVIDHEQDALLAVPACASCADRQWHLGQSGPRLSDAWWIA